MRFLVALSLAACSSQSPATIVVGLQGESIPNAASARVIVHVADRVAADGTLELARGPLFPAETRISGTSREPIDVRVEVYSGGNPPATIMTRTARASFVPGEPRLLRLRLDPRCVVNVPGIAWGPTCTVAHQTCVAGRCNDDSLLDSDLEPYRDHWYDDPADACLIADASTPEAHLGTGQSAYVALTANEMVPVEKGPQGGHHVYVGVRMVGTSQSHSTITIRGTQPDTSLSIPPTAFILALEPRPDGWCETYGLRYQLDNGGIDYTQFLGKPLRLSVDVQDPAGRHAADSVVVQVASMVTGQ